jgi:hypothetical protein
MTDNKGLKIFGFVLGGVTIAVALIAAGTVQVQNQQQADPTVMNPHTIEFLANPAKIRP